jgi:hypothetical protein
MKKKASFRKDIKQAFLHRLSKEKLSPKKRQARPNGPNYNITTVYRLLTDI